MATKNEKEIGFFETLEKFKNGGEINWSEIIEEKSMTELTIILDDVLFQLDLSQLENIKDEVQYEIQKQFIKFFYGLLECTSLKVVKEDFNIDNIDFEFEQNIYNNSATVRKLYKMIDNIIRKRELKVVNNLTQELSNLPTIEQIETLKEGLDSIFKDKSEGELRMIESILEYNDPNMKVVKDMISAPLKKEEIKEFDKNGDNITKR